MRDAEGGNSVGFGLRPLLRRGRIGKLVSSADGRVERRFVGSDSVRRTAFLSTSIRLVFAFF